MRSDKAGLASLFLLAMSVLMMEVCLTRAFSIISWHHFAYLIISLALLGFGAAGSYLTVSRRFGGNGNDDRTSLAHFAWLYALAAGGAIVVVSKIRFYPEDIALNGDYSNAISLLLMYVTVGVPFFFAGVCIGRLVSMAGDRVNQFYLIDLVGAGIGALLSLAVINLLGAVSGIFFCAVLGALAACLLGDGGIRWRRWAYRLTLVGTVVLTALTWRYGKALPLYYPPSKDLFRNEHNVVYSGWHVVGKIDIAAPKAMYWLGGGTLSQRYTGPPPEVMGIYQDGAAPTGILMLKGPPEDERILGELLQGIAYTVRPAERALVIGIGGGTDGLIALHYGTREVVGVDLNPVTIHAVSNVYRDRCPALWDGGRFRMELAEGRHYLTRTGQQYDVIQLSGVDTFTALSSGAYALAENFLYTTEAMKDFWDHLRPEGILSFSRWLFSPERENLRLVNTQLAMLEAAGVADGAKHMVVVKGPARLPWAEVLLKKTPFTPDQVQALSKWVTDRQFEMLYDPYTPRSNEFNDFISASASGRSQLIHDYVFNVQPTTDDDPFFFQYYRWSSVFARLGGKSGLAGSSGGYGITRIPLGYIVLALSLAQMLVLGLVFILAPLRMKGRLPAARPGRAGVFLYFAALGLGFIFIEIALLQKLSVFVGGPVYSMAITLASILVFSGIGSHIGRAFAGNPGRWVPLVIGALAAVVLAETWFLNRALAGLMGLGLTMRWLVAAVAVLPVGLLLGMPFPTGLRILQRIDEAARPWAWGINAFATVIGSMLSVLLSIEMGFTFTLLTAVVIYIVGGLGLLYAIRRAPA